MKKNNLVQLAIEVSGCILIISIVSPIVVDGIINIKNQIERIE